MSETATLLLEVGCEEIPDRMVEGARRDLAAAVEASLREHRLLQAGAPGETGREEVRSYATPRRLAVQVPGVVRRQPDETQEVTGPPVKAAYDADGNPTRAAQGFAAGQGVEVADLYRVAGPKGEVVAARRTRAGRPAVEVLSEILPGTVLGLSFPKAMQWGEGGVTFVRPIRWLVALLDRAVIPFSVAGVQSGRGSMPRRGSGQPEVKLADAQDYVEALRQVEVVVDVEERRAALRQAVAGLVARDGGRVLPDPGLEEIVLNLVEYPGAVAGAFPAPFLELPAEVLTTTLRHHQRCFSVAGGDGGLKAGFVAAINAPSDPDGAITRGYERVIAGRLADARFFYTEDRKRPLAARLEVLERTRFHAALGSYAAKVRRLEGLVAELAGLAGVKGEVVERAVQAACLCKCDLATQMENEFPELQGVVGGLYAREEGEPAPVWRAIYDHYRPEGLGDELPRDTEGALLALADRLDTLVGLMGVGVEPKGSRDPFALRRAALGAIRILVERPLHLSIDAALAAARRGYDAGEVEWKLDGVELAGKVRAFLEGRLRHLLENDAAGHRYDSITAVLAAGWDDAADAAARLAALTAIRGQEDFEALAAASKRIRNILGQAAERHGIVDEDRVDADRLEDPAERELHAAARRAAEVVEEAAARRDHAAALAAVAALRPQVDRFFDSVLVMAEDADLRRNRLALLASVARLYAREADFAEIVVEGGA